MSVSKLLKEQEAWINSATQNIDTRKTTVRDLEFPEDLNKKRQGEIQERIETLKIQRDAKVRQYDAAIKEQEEELEQLKKELDLSGRGGTSGRTPGVITDGRRPIVENPGRVVTPAPAPTPKRAKSAKKATKKTSTKKSTLKTKAKRRTKRSG